MSRASVEVIAEMTTKDGEKYHRTFTVTYLTGSLHINVDAAETVHIQHGRTTQDET